MVGEQATRADLKRLRKRIKTMQSRGRTAIRDTQEPLHEEVLRIQRERFRTQGASEGASWPAQQPKWAKLKLRLGIAPIPLRWVGGKHERLYPSLVRRAHKDHFFRVVGKRLEVGTSVPYAARHDQGVGRNPFGEKIPKRSLTTLSPATQTALATHIAHFVATGESKL